jgi:hypothetical protein
MHMGIRLRNDGVCDFEEENESELMGDVELPPTIEEKM